MARLQHALQLGLLCGAGAFALSKAVRPLARGLRRLTRRPLSLSATPQQQMLPPPVQGSAVGFEEIATIPKPGAQGISLVRFSPDDRHVTFLSSESGASLTQQLYAHDRTTGKTKKVLAEAPGGGEESTFSREEQLRRERARIMSTGVTEYSWAKKANLLLVQLDGALYVQDGVGEGAEATLRRLFDPAAFAAVGTGPLLDAKLSDDGRTCAFVWANEVCCCAVPPADAGPDAATPRRLTVGARGEGKTNGLADYCAQEEMDRYEGFWVSSAASHLAFEEVHLESTIHIVSRRL